MKRYRLELNERGPDYEVVFDEGGYWVVGDEADDAIAAALARAEAAERLAVWAVHNCPSIGITTAGWPTLNWYDPPEPRVYNRRAIRLDGTTDTDLLRALKEASGIDYPTSST